ncbi:MAG: DUF1552 domain-containing protein, partial [Proteobacteria bacterium]
SRWKSNISVLRGMNLYAAEGGAHPGSFATAATGFNGATAYLNSKQVSIDVLIAQAISDNTILKNRRQMILSPGLGGGTDSHGLPYGNRESYTFQKNAGDPVRVTTYAPAISDAKDILARYFGVGVPAAQNVVSRRQLLDEVFADFQKVRSSASIGSEDRVKLDSYMGLLHDIESEIDSPAPAALKAPQLEAELSPPLLSRKSGESDKDYYARQTAVTVSWLATNRTAATNIRTRNQMRLIAAAFAVDSTRVASINLGGLGSHGIHHASNMHQRNENSSAEMAEYFGAHRAGAEQVAFLMDCLASVSDSNGQKVLDQSVVYWNQQYGCVHTSGGGHSRENFPVLLGGGAESKLQFNRYIDYSVQGSMGTSIGLPLNNLLVTLMNCFGLGSSKYETSTPGYGSYDTSTIAQLPSAVLTTAGRRSALPLLYTGNAMG